MSDWVCLTEKGSSFHAKHKNAENRTESAP